MVKTPLADLDLTDAPAPPEEAAPRPLLADMAARADEAAALLAALAHPKRLLVLCALTDGEHTVGTLASRAQLPQATLSQHLARLRLQGLVATRRHKTSIHYRIADPTIQALLAVLQDRFCQEE